MGTQPQLTTAEGWLGILTQVTATKPDLLRVIAPNQLFKNRIAVNLIPAQIHPRNRPGVPNIIQWICVQYQEVRAHSRLDQTHVM